MNLRLSVPELRRQPTLNLQVVQLQFDYVNALREVPAHISCPDVQSGNFATLELRLDDHCSPSEIPGGTANRARLNSSIRRRSLKPQPQRKAWMRLCWTNFPPRSRGVRILFLRKISFSDLLNCLAARKLKKLCRSAKKTMRQFPTRRPAALSEIQFSPDFPTLLELLVRLRRRDIGIHVPLVYQRRARIDKDWKW